MTSNMTKQLFRFAPQSAYRLGNGITLHQMRFVLRPMLAFIRAVSSDRHRSSPSAAHVGSSTFSSDRSFNLKQETCWETLVYLSNEFKKLPPNQRTEAMREVIAIVDTGATTSITHVRELFVKLIKLQKPAHALEAELEIPFSDPKANRPGYTPPRTVNFEASPYNPEVTNRSDAVLEEEFRGQGLDWEYITDI